MAIESIPVEVVVAAPPMAIALVLLAIVPLPSDTVFAAVADALRPIANALEPDVAEAPLPIAILPIPLIACAPCPRATVSAWVASVPFPIATALFAEVVAVFPMAIVLVPAVTLDALPMAIELSVAAANVAVAPMAIPPRILGFTAALAAGGNVPAASATRIHRLS